MFNPPARYTLRRGEPLPQDAPEGARAIIMPGAVEWEFRRGVWVDLGTPGEDRNTALLEAILQELQGLREELQAR